MNECVTNSPEETLALGRQWGTAAQPGWVFGLSGDLGTGKTQLVKGLAQGLEIREPILSPTFALVHQYNRGRIPLAHLDLYRLDSPDQVIGAGLEQFIYDPTLVVVVEWIERWFGSDAPSLTAGGRYRYVHIDAVGELSRRITYEDTRA
jgi:tRNA threonylcarbamoyladenosine biosynthesis protein TsaE